MAVIDAVLAGDPDAVRSALAADPATVDLRLPDGTGLLHLAAATCTVDGAIPSQDGPPGALEVVRVLLAAGVDVTATDGRGATALHCAALGHHPDLVTILLDAGAPRDGRLLGQDGGSPLALALFYANTDVALLLADPPVPDNLRVAASLGRDLDRFVASGGGLAPAAAAGTAFQRPLDAFPERVPPGDDQWVLDDALTYAARHGQTAAMAWLVDHGADVDGNPYRGTALLWAVYADRGEAAAWLLDHGADPDLRHGFGGSEHGEGATALHLAAQYASLACLDLLLTRGADATVRDDLFDATPWGWAHHEGVEESLAVFARHGITA